MTTSSDTERETQKILDSIRELISKCEKDPALFEKVSKELDEAIDIVTETTTSEH